MLGHIKKVAQVNNNLDVLQEWAEDEIEELQETIDFVQSTMGCSFLGHADLSTTLIYPHIFDEEVKTTLKSFRQEAVAA